jgi:8-oxo-dGTP diphosphatase
MFEYEYPRPAASVDIVVSRMIDGEEHILLIQRKHPPYQGSWALPGGFLDMGETLEQAAVRELKEETCLVASSVYQIGTFSAVDRDPRSRVISTAFEANVDVQQSPIAADDAADWQWKRLENLDCETELAFDHENIIKVWKKKRPLQA